MNSSRRMAVLLEELSFRLYFGAVHGRCENLFAAPSSTNFAACGLDLGAGGAVEAIFSASTSRRIDCTGCSSSIRIKRATSSSLALPGKLVLRRTALPGPVGRQRPLQPSRPPVPARHPARRAPPLRPRNPLRHRPARPPSPVGLHRLGNGLDTGTLRTRRGGFRHGLLRRRRFSHGHLCRGRSRNGFFRLGFFCRGCFHDGFRLRCCGGLGFRDFGSHFGSYGLHIFSSIADSLLGSRKIRIFSSHLSTRF